MKRRDFLLSSLCLTGLTSHAQAQPSPGRAKLAILSPNSPLSADPASDGWLSIFLRTLEELGYVEGRNLRIEFRFAENRLDRLPKLAAELVAWRPDVIYTFTTGGAHAAANATKTIPIVVGPAGEAVLLALAGNLARPVGNVTGLSLEGSGQYEKCLELLKELSPRTSRIGVLVNPDNPAWADYPAVLDQAAERLGLVLQRTESRGSTDIDQVLAALDSEKLDALLLANDSAFFSEDAGPRIIKFARNRHLPSASTAFDYVRRGGLLALGTDQAFIRRRAAEYVRRIIEGARPADLPVERPAKFQLSINLLTAKAIGVTIPPSLLVRADEVIE